MELFKRRHWIALAERCTKEYDVNVFFNLFKKSVSFGLLRPVTYCKSNFDCRTRGRLLSL